MGKDSNNLILFQSDMSSSRRADICEHYNLPAFRVLVSSTGTVDNLLNSLDNECFAVQTIDVCRGFYYVNFLVNFFAFFLLE